MSLQVEDMQRDKEALHEAHIAELELQSGHYADLAAKLRKAQAFADTQARAVAAAEVNPISTPKASPGCIILILLFLDPLLPPHNGDNLSVTSCRKKQPWQITSQ